MNPQADAYKSPPPPRPGVSHGETFTGTMKRNPIIPSPAKKPPAFTGPRERLRQMLVRMRQLEGDPRFISILPIIPLQTVVAVALAFLVRGSKTAAALGTWLSNPLTIPLVYYVNYKVGCILLGYHSTVDHIAFTSFSQLMARGIEVTRAMILGGVVIGAVLGVAAYFVTLHIYRSLRNRSRPTDISSGPAT